MPFNLHRRHVLWLLAPLALMGGYAAYLIRPPLTSSPGFLTYYYTSNAFKSSDCMADTGDGSPPCIDGGNGTVSVTFGGVAAGFTGTVTKPSQVLSWSADLDNVGVHLKTGDDLFTVSFTFVNGQITKWDFEAFDSLFTQGFETFYNGPRTGIDSYSTFTMGGVPKSIGHRETPPRNMDQSKNARDVMHPAGPGKLRQSHRHWVRQEIRAGS